jgi:hypothetical protein
VTWPASIPVGRQYASERKRGVLTSEGRLHGTAILYPTTQVIHRLQGFLPIKKSLQIRIIWAWLNLVPRPEAGEAQLPGGLAAQQLLQRDRHIRSGFPAVFPLAGSRLSD